MAKATMSRREVLVAIYMEKQAELREHENFMESECPGLLDALRNVLNGDVLPTIDEVEKIEEEVQTNRATDLGEITLLQPRFCKMRDPNERPRLMNGEPRRLLEHLVRQLPPGDISSARFSAIYPEISNSTVSNTLHTIAADKSINFHKKGFGWWTVRGDE